METQLQETIENFKSEAFYCIMWLTKPANGLKYWRPETAIPSVFKAATAHLYSTPLSKVKEKCKFIKNLLI